MLNYMVHRQLKIIRKQNGLSQQQVADVLGISRSAYCGYETGRRSPDVITIIKLSEFYRLPLDKFFEKRIPAEYVYDDDYYEGQPDTRYLSQLSKEEKDLIVKYRTLGAEHQKEVLNLLIEK